MCAQNRRSIKDVTIGCINSSTSTRERLRSSVLKVVPHSDHTHCVQQVVAFFKCMFLNMSWEPGDVQADLPLSSSEYMHTSIL